MISCAWILSSQARKRCFDLLTKSYEHIFKKYAGCNMTPLSTKTRRSICTRPIVTKAFDKLSRAVSVKDTSYNWKNGEATYFILLTRYCSFISVCFSFLVGSQVRIDSNQIKFLNFQNSILGLRFEYIYCHMSFKNCMMSFKEMNPCVQLNLSSRRVL